MKTYSFALAAAMMIAGNTVFAQQQTSNLVVDEFVSPYTADGFTRFDIRVGITQVKIETYRGRETKQ